MAPPPKSCHEGTGSEYDSVLLSAGAGPLRTQLLHLAGTTAAGAAIDGSDHQWFQDERRHDLIVILDDATSEI
jgi:hypothetical protein